jgi:hypothetical protein
MNTIKLVQRIRMDVLDGIGLLSTMCMIPRQERMEWLENLVVTTDMDKAHTDQMKAASRASFMGRLHIDLLHY